MWECEQYTGDSEEVAGGLRQMDYLAKLSFAMKTAC